MSSSGSVVAGNGVTSRNWTPEQAARFEFELCRLLSSDRRAQDVYFRKLHVLRASSSGKGMGHSAKRQAQRADDAAPVGAPTTTRDEHEPAAAMNVEAAGGLPAGDDAPGGATGAEQLAPRRRRRAKSEEQVRKGLERLARKHYERFVLRCIAATKRLGSPRVLFTVIRFCGRLMQLIQGDVSLRLRLREERDAWRDVHVVDGPIRYHRLWRGSLMETADRVRYGRRGEA